MYTRIISKCWCGTFEFYTRNVMESFSSTLERISEHRCGPHSPVVPRSRLRCYTSTTLFGVSLVFAVKNFHGLGSVLGDRSVWIKIFINWSSSTRPGRRGHPILQEKIKAHELEQHAGISHFSNIQVKYLKRTASEWIGSLRNSLGITSFLPRISVEFWMTYMCCDLNITLDGLCVIKDRKKGCRKKRSPSTWPRVVVFEQMVGKLPLGNQ